tara:strand:+ start:2858 stop:4486 length:1629 start_codon:yes stop_codon:yes gene_type:complete
MSINISIPDVDQNLHPKITVLGVGGSGGNAVNNMISSNLEGVDFLIANTDAQALQISKCVNKIQLGLNTTRGLGAGMRPDVGKQAAEETIEELSEKLEGSHMLFIAAGMGGGTGTGAAPVIAKLAREKGILTVGVVTKPFHFEGSQRMKLADKGIESIQQHVDTLLTIPNQNLFRIANEKTTFADAFKMADDVLYAGVRGVTDLMVQPGMINLDFSDVKTVMSEMGKAMMGTGEASGEGRAVAAAEAAIANPLIDDVSLKGAKGLIINITGGKDITLYEVDEAANRIKEEVDDEANIIYGTTCDDRLEGVVRVSIVATGIDLDNSFIPKPLDNFSSISIDNSVYHKDSINNEVLSESNIVNHSESLSNNEFADNKIENISFDENLMDNKEEAVEEDVEETVEEIEEDLGEYQKEHDTETSYDNNILNKNNLNADDELTEKNIDENIDDNQSSILTSKPTVKRLSLFDTQEKVNEDLLSESKERSEPIISDNDEENHSINKLDSEEIIEDEFNAEESDSTNEFNQETEEELLDIPTFLRRQAN